MSEDVLLCMILFIMFIYVASEYMTPLNRYEYDEVEQIQKILREQSKDREITMKIERISREAEKLLEESRKLKENNILSNNQTYKKGQIIRLKTKAIVFRCKEKELGEHLNPVYFIDGDSLILEQGTQLELVQYVKEIDYDNSTIIDKSSLYARVLVNTHGVPAGTLVYILRASNTESFLKQPLEKPKIPSL